MPLFMEFGSTTNLYIGTWYSYYVPTLCNSMFIPFILWISIVSSSFMMLLYISSILKERIKQMVVEIIVYLYNRDEE